MGGAGNGRPDPLAGGCGKGFDCSELDCLRFDGRDSILDGGFTGGGGSGPLRPGVVGRGLDTPAPCELLGGGGGLNPGGFIAGPLAPIITT